jgi:hypothetical protein
LLNIINSQCNGSEYKIFDLKELVASFPDRLNTDIEQIRELLKNLALKEYVSVKYADGDEYCLTALPKGRSVTMGLESLPRRSIWRKKLLQSLPSFLGAAAGAALVLLLAALF